MIDVIHQILGPLHELSCFIAAYPHRQMRALAPELNNNTPNNVTTIGQCFKVWNNKIL